MNRPAVGNDVVDLVDPRCVGKARDERFLARVLTARERTLVAEAVDPDRTLWTLWAAKEAAFKAVSKATRQVPVFVHADFEVQVQDEAGGNVRWRRMELPFLVRGGRSTGSLHVVAWCEPPRPRMAGGSSTVDEGAPLRERLSRRELRGVHSAASAHVRLEARAHLARVSGTPEEELEIVCEKGPAGRMPPRVLRRGAPAPWDVSLSHHGHLVAWVVALPVGPGERATEPDLPAPVGRAGRGRQGAHGRGAPDRGVRDGGVRDERA